MSTRVVLLGDSTVGKSSLLATFVDGDAGAGQYSTVGADLRKKTVSVDGKSLTLDVCTKILSLSTCGTVHR